MVLKGGILQMVLKYVLQTNPSFEGLTSLVEMTSSLLDSPVLPHSKYWIHKLLDCKGAWMTFHLFCPNAWFPLASMYQGHHRHVFNTSTCVGHLHFKVHLFCTFRHSPSSSGAPEGVRCSAFDRAPRVQWHLLWHKWWQHAPRLAGCN